MKSKISLQACMETAWDDSEYPEDLKVIVEFSGESTLEQVVTGFKMFLKAMEYSEKLVEEGVFYENPNKNSQ